MLELFNHQKIGIQFATTRKNLLIADEMGLGKSAESILAAKELGYKKILVVCKNTARKKWLEEIALWDPENKDKAIRLNGSTKVKDDTLLKALVNPDIIYIVTNFDYLRHSNALYSLDNIECLIIDEAHKLKNRKTKLVKAVKTFSRLPQKIMMLTGSPMQNYPHEIWSLLNILYPQTFSSFWRFVERYCYVSDDFFGKKIQGSRNEDELHRILQDIMIRRLKEECLDMPSKVYEPEYIELKPAQRKIYNQMADLAITMINESTILTAQIVIAQIIRLKQIAISTAMIGETQNPQSAKFDWLLNFVGEEYPDEKVTIFSNFAKSLSLFAEILDKNKINYVKYTGKENENQREENQRLFRYSKYINVFLATVQTGGESIDLPESHLCIHLDKHWNPEINKQAEDRLHRIPQKNTVTVISLIAEHTVDELIELGIKNKVDIIQRILKDRERLNNATRV